MPSDVVSGTVTFPFDSHGFYRTRNPIDGIEGAHTIETFIYYIVLFITVT